MQLHAEIVDLSAEAAAAILGQPGDYQGQWYMAWDPNTESFTNIVLSSMGE